MTDRRILVVDDEPLFREEVVAFLNGPTCASQNWYAEAAASGEEALSRLKQTGYDVMLLDINMPGLDGMEVLRQMQEGRLLERTYVIMLSAYGVYENVVAAMRGGAKDFVNKSERPDQWVMRIERGFEWQELNRRRRQAEEELRLLAREVGHDIGGSMYFVLTQRVQALAKLVEGDAEGERSIEVIEQILARIKRLADELGHVAIAFDSSEMWRWEALDVQRLLERLLEEFRFAHPNVTIVREWESLPPIQGSRVQLERTFYNLLTNAGRAMPSGGTLTVRARREGADWIVIEIRDTGVGMSPEAQKKAFRIGFSDWRNGVRGTGLGLYVALRNIENHGGRIELTSAVGEGTTIAVHLPIRSGESLSGVV